MTATVTTPTALSARKALSFGGVLRSEWIKLRSLRSTWWFFGVLVVLTVGLSSQIAPGASFEGVTFVPRQEDAQILALQAVTVSTDFAALLVSSLGVLVIAGEYGNGSIRSTLTAVPRRTPALFAKGIVFAVATFVVAGVAYAATLPLSAAMMAGNDVSVDLADARLWLSVLAAVLYLVLVGLIAFSVGALVRNTAAGITIAVAIVLVAPLAIELILGIVPAAWTQNLGSLLPMSAGRAFYAYPAVWGDGPGAAASAPVPDGVWMFEPWQGGLVLVAWVVVLFGAAAVLLKRRDA